MTRIVHKSIGIIDNELFIIHYKKSTPVICQQTSKMSFEVLLWFKYSLFLTSRTSAFLNFDKYSLFRKISLYLR